MKRIYILFLTFPLLWWLPEISATASAHFSMGTPTSVPAIPEPFFILLMGVVLLVAASGCRFILGKNQNSQI
jgi:hypothetical protein